MRSAERFDTAFSSVTKTTSASSTLIGIPSLLVLPPRPSPAS
jgi:hypothetical protein